MKRFLYLRCKKIMSYKLFLKLDRLPKSLNQSLRTHYHQRHNENKFWDWLISQNVLGKTPPKPITNGSLTIMRHSHRFLDYDGLVGSMKPVVDALVTAGVLHSDSWNVLGRWNVDQKFRSEKEGQMIEILIQELPDKRN